MTHYQGVGRVDFQPRDAGAVEASADHLGDVADLPRLQPAVTGPALVFSRWVSARFLASGSDGPIAALQKFIKLSLTVAVLQLLVETVFFNWRGDYAARTRICERMEEGF
jgi:hypothetical protein